MRSRILAVALLALPALAFAQGSLTPPGGPAETMKTLDQLEARTPVQKGSPGVNTQANGGFTLDRPGSYYLTTGFSVTSGNALTIAASDITLDLGGFTLSSTASPAEGSAILIQASLSNVRIHHGQIRSTTTYTAPSFTLGGFYGGIFAQDFTDTCRIDNIAIRGVALSGIYLPGENSAVRDCSVVTCGSSGIVAANIHSSTAQICGATAIRGMTVADCVGATVADTGEGISAVTASNCRGTGKGSHGVYTTSAALNCAGRSTDGIGLYSLGSATNCTGASISGTGLHALLAQSCTGTSSSAAGVLAIQTAENCYGETATGPYGLACGRAATNCFGNTTTGTATAFGLYADIATGCFGFSTTGSAGLFAKNATNCIGTTATGTYGLHALKLATNCTGTITSTAGGTAGLRTGIASHCTGENLSTTANTYGLYATQSAHYSNGGGVIGMFASVSASYCHGTASTIGGVAIQVGAVGSGIAVCCTSGAGTITAVSKYLMP